MKKSLILLPVLLLTMTGCVAITRDQTSIESDTVGITAAYSPTSGSIISAKIGIVHERMVFNPVSTNGPISAAPIDQTVNAKISPLSQTVTQSIHMGR